MPDGPARVWQWAEQDGIYNAEHRGSRASPERQRQNGNEPEFGILAENSGGVAQVHQSARMVN